MSGVGRAARRRWWRHPLVHLVTIMLLAAAVYSNSFSVPFHWDGIRMLRDSAVIHDLDNLRDPALCERRQFQEQICRRQLAYHSFALNYAAHGYDVAGYHVVNLALHMVAALGVYALVLALFAAPRMRGSSLARDRTLIALCAASLFVAHPLQTMAVQGRMIWGIVALNAEDPDVGSRISFTYKVHGHLEGGFTELAPVVDRVIGAQLDRLGERLKR